MSKDSPLTSQILEAANADLRLFSESLRQGPSAELYEMAAHHFGWDEDGGPGKGVRPLLCLLSSAAAGGDWRRALPAATSVELIHNFSLIHDDIEDGSDLRRHRPTLWKLWGLPQAVNAGDALFALARLSSYRLLELGHDASIVLRVQHMLDETCLDLMKGQYLDLSFDVEQPRVLERYFGTRKLADIRYDPYLQTLSQLVIEFSEPIKLNWAILDLASKICNSNPLCDVCPIVDGCLSAQSKNA